MLTLKTSELQSLINKSLKAASHNILYPITTMIDISAENGVLKLTTTDSTNYLVLKRAVPKDMSFGAALPIDTFAKLVLKTTSETISLDVVDNTLKIVGNGTYTIGLTSVYEDEVTRFNAPQLSDEENVIDYITEIDINKLRSIVASNSSSLAVNLYFPALTGYYIDDKQSISSNGVVITRNLLGMFDKPVLISKDLMSLLTLIESEKAGMTIYEDLSVKVETDTMDIIGNLMEEITEYPVDTIVGLVDESYDNFCEVSRVDLIKVLDRMGLFVESYDGEGILLNFDKSGLIVTSRRNSASEKVSYVNGNSKISNSFVCIVNINNLITQLKSHTEDNVVIYFGKENAIKISGSNICQVILTIEEDDGN